METKQEIHEAARACAMRSRRGEEFQGERSELEGSTGTGGEAGGRGGRTMGKGKR